MVDKIEFSTLIASTVHDMKNILMVMDQTYDNLVAQLPIELQQSAEAQLISQESQRLNAMLVQLLGMYKFEHGQLPLQGNYYPVDELFEELQNRYARLLQSRAVTLRIELDHPDLEGFFDRSLIATVLDNAICNALKYCRGKIVLHATAVEGFIVLCVCDDGPGYPAEMLGCIRQREASSINRASGSTGLGLYFAASIVAMHDQPDRQARLELCNGEVLTGACMRIILPLPSLF